MTCYRHPDRRAGVRCQRCERAICPDCMHQASVGFHCTECTKVGAQKVLRARDLGPDDVTTRVLIALNVGAFVLTAVVGGSAIGGGGELFNRFVLFGPWIDVDGEWWRLVSSGFLHWGLLHLAMNMYALWILGPQLEAALGRRWFVGTYLAALLGGSFGALLLDPLAATAGASGAIFGLMGVAVVMQRARGINLWQSGLGTVLVINLVLTFSISGISIGGHVGGLVAGLAAGWLFVEIGVRQRRDREAFAALVALGVSVALGGLWAASQWPNALSG